MGSAEDTGTHPWGGIVTEKRKGGFAQADIDRIKRDADLVKIIGRRVDLKKSGTTYRGSCPFHDGSSTSFVVAPKAKRYRCYGCDATGDVFEWFKRTEHLDFPDAVRAAAREAGIHLEEDDLPTDARPAEAPAPPQEVTGDPEPTPSPESAPAAPSGPAAAAGEADEGQAQGPISGDAVAKAREIDVAAVWTAIAERQNLWRERVRTWAIERGFGVHIADAIARSGEAAGVPVDLPEPLDRDAQLLRWSPLDLWLPVRRADGQVVSIERRWFRGQGAPPRGMTKSALLKHGLNEAPDWDPDREVFKIPALPRAAMFGSLSRAVEAAAKGEPVILVEGSPDYLGALGASLVRQRGAILGSPGCSRLPSIASAFVTAVERHLPRIEAGSFPVYVVPHVGDSKRIGERKAWAAAVRLCDVARVSWCPPVRFDVDPETGHVARRRPAKADLADVIQGERDPVGAFWAVIEAGVRVYETLEPEARFETRRDVLADWRSKADWELEKAFYRLPLDEMIEYMHWKVPYTDDGDAGAPERCRSVPALDTESGLTRVSRMVDRWLEHHGITFIATQDKGQFVWDPFERARMVPRDRAIKRLVKVGSRNTWKGWLSLIGQINKKDPLGKQIAEFVESRAQLSADHELRSWMAADGSLARPSVRLHLHTVQEEIAVIEPRSIRLAQNRGKSILVPADDMAAPIEWMTGVTPDEAGRRLWALIGRYITIRPEERAMAMSWALLSPIRELLDARPFVWATGEKGAGKSFLGKLLMALFYGGKQSPGVFTNAAKWEAAREWPLLCDENAERRFLNNEDELFLLTAATGTARHRRAADSDWGLVRQDVRTMVHLSAIGRPWNPELQRRALLLQHDKRYRLPGEAVRNSEVLGAVRSERSALWSGLARLYAERIMPALEANEHHRYADQVPGDHPMWEMREALGVMGVIGDVLSLTTAEWGKGGFAQFGAWTTALDDRIRDARRYSDPLASALDQLLHEWNRVEITPYGEKRRPAHEDGQLVCRPIYGLAPKLRSEGRPSWTFDPENAETSERTHEPLVIGVMGDYPSLHRDLERAVLNRRGFLDHFPTPDEVRHNIRNVIGWSSTPASRHGRRGMRVYRWMLEPITEEDDRPDDSPATHRDAA